MKKVDKLDEDEDYKKLHGDYLKQLEELTGQKIPAPKGTSSWGGAKEEDKKEEPQEAEAEAKEEAAKEDAPTEASEKKDEKKEDKGLEGVY